MKAIIVDSCQWSYPDVHSYQSGSERGEFVALKNSQATFQIHVWEAVGDVMVSVPAEVHSEIFREIAVPVESCPGLSGNEPNFPERKAPYTVYDCLAPGSLSVSDSFGAAGFYVSVPTPEAGLCSFLVTVTDSNGQVVSLPVEIEVLPAALPEETLDIAIGYSGYTAANKHGVRYLSPEFDALDTEYLKMLRRMHQNRLFVAPPQGEKDGEGRWTFDFSVFNKYVEKALSLGFTGFNIYGLAFRKSWDGPDIQVRGMDSMSREAYVYLSDFAGALRQNLNSRGWLDGSMFAIGVADEPNEADAVTYRALCGVMRRLLPEISLYDAVTCAPLYGALDIWVPRSDEYMAHREVFDYYRASGDKLWYYVCLYPRGDGYINRFMDIPLLATRYQFWANYLYSFSGYLHWTVNDYQGGGDPFKESCTRHVNAGSESILPPGDDKLIYPGDNGPWMSIRLEAQREGAEEYEMLRVIGEKDRTLADSLCQSCLSSFTKAEYSVDLFRQTHRRILEAYADAVSD